MNSIDDTSPVFSECLDHVRWASAVLVLIGHARNLFFVPLKNVNDPNILEYLFYGITGFQNEAVICFFVISGYLIGGKLLKYYQTGHVPVAGYIIDRLVRLYIVLIPSFALALLAQSEGYCPSETLMDWGTNLIFLQHILVDTTQCNVPLWSLANEFWYYSIGLFVVLFLLKYKKSAVIGLVICILILLLDNFDRENVLLNLPIWCAGLFLIWSTSLQRYDPGLLVSGGILLIAMIISRSHVADSMFVIRDFFTAFGIFLFLLSARNLKIPPLAPRFARFMSSFSFSLYLIHWPTLLLLRGSLPERNFQPNEPRFILIYIGVCIACLLIAYGFSLVTERNTVTVRSFARSVFMGRG